MTTVDDLRALAAALPEVTEGSHFRLTAFRVRGKPFVTVEPDGAHALFGLDEPAIRAAVAEDPAGFGEVWRGDRLVGLRVVLARVPVGRLDALVRAAWRRRAPRALAAGLDGGDGAGR